MAKRKGASRRATVGGNGRRRMMLIILVTTQRRTTHRVAHVSNGASDRPPSAARLALSARDVGVA
eukprot:804770-Prymnesium_polylepis.1